MAVLFYGNTSSSRNSNSNTNSGSLQSVESELPSLVRTITAILCHLFSLFDKCPAGFVVLTTNNPLYQ